MMRAARWIFATVLPATLAGACAPGDPIELQSHAVQSDPCRECQSMLVECSSTSKNQLQFAECRDLWLTCQRDRGIGGDECRNPRDELACDLCRERLDECDGAPEECEAQFEACKGFLIRRSDLVEQCSEVAGDPAAAACQVCGKDFAKCASDSEGHNGAQLCASMFIDCVAANELTSDCKAPAGFLACELCEDVRAGCDAVGGSTCSADYDACIAALAANVTCDVNAGAGGGTSGTDTCAHDVCAFGEALESGCSPCASAVCAQDPYCCNTTAGQWDSFCLEVAATLESCGCAPPPPPACAHSACEYGSALASGCSPCVTQICALDPYCCTTKWDNYCVNAATTTSGCGCFI